MTQNNEEAFGDLTLINDDCLKILSNIINERNISLILADPPYGTTALDWDNILNFNDMWKQLDLLNESIPILLFGIQPFTSQLICSNLPLFKYCWHWEKERLTNIHQVKKRAGKTIEDIAVFYKKQPLYNPQMQKHEGRRRTNKVKNGKLGKLTDGGEKKVKEYKDNGLRYPTQLLKFKRDVLTSNLHPTQKPVALLEFLIKTYTNEGDIVLDFTMGSGSTGIACLNTGRKFIGIEKNNEFFEVAEKRLRRIDNDK